MAPFASPTLEQLTGLVFELASQLHSERVHRIALETALEARSILDPDAADSLSADPTVRARSKAALERSMNGIMRILTENADPKTPLRSAEMVGGQSKTLMEP